MTDKTPRDLPVPYPRYVSLSIAPQCYAGEGRTNPRSELDFPSGYPSWEWKDTHTVGVTLVRMRQAPNISLAWFLE